MSQNANGNPWRELERELNPRQREAVFSTAAHCLVLAGPGTGKTRTLVNRAVYLVSAAGEEPGAILTLTFTRKAARVMVERLARYLGESAGALRTGTFHHFCLELLRGQAGQGPVPRDFSVADEARQLRALERAWNRLAFSARPPDERELRFLLGRFGAHRAQREPGQLSALQLELFAEYQRLLRDERAIDFDDILDLSRQLLTEDAALLAATRARWRRVLVDEFQDTDALQYQLLRLLVPEAGSSFVVADDQQSIYAWRGADRRNVERYREDYAPAELRLEENYRNRDAILDGALAVLAAGGEPRRELVSRAPGAGSLRLEAFPSEREEADFLAADIRRARARERRLHWGDIAILYPKHAIGEYLETRLMAERLPVELVSGRALLAQERIRRVVAALRLLRHGGDDEALATLLAGQLDESAYALLRRVARRAGDSLRAGLDRLLRGAGQLRALRGRWQAFQAGPGAGAADDARWLAAWRAAFPAGFELEAYLDAEGAGLEAAAAPADADAGALRRALLAAGERLEQLSRLPWLLDGIVARLGNLRAGQGGRSLSQLVREILLDFADPDAGAGELPGDPATVPGLDALLDALREQLRRGRRVLVETPAAPAGASALLMDLLRGGLEPWHAQCLVALGAEAGPPPADSLRLQAEGDRLRLVGLPQGTLEATGAPAALLVFRLYQLWRGAEHRPLKDFVLFDLETTGVDPQRCELIEVAAIRFEDGRESAHFSSLLKPQGPIPPEATQVHGITDAMVAAAPSPAQLLPEFLAFLGERDLVAHNGASFDFPLLRRVAREQGLVPPRNALFDSLALARRLFPGERNALGALMARFGVKAAARHRALEDCRALAAVFAELQAAQLAALRRRVGREALAPAALALLLMEGERLQALAARDGESFALFQAGVRRLLASGSGWLDRLLPGDGEAPPAAARQALEAALLAAAGLDGEAPDLFTGLRSEEERFLALVPRFDELFLGDSLAAFLDFLALYQAPDLAGGGNAVQLMTIHAAKGLEFERVYIVGLEENVLPGFYALRSGDPEELAEERRLLFVAMTRAASSLTLTRADSRGGFRQAPSRFLTGLAPAGSEAAAL